MLLFNEEGLGKVKLQLPEIHCSSCIVLLENLTEIEKGILDVKVHFSRKEATFTYRTDALKLSELAAILAYIGYTPDFKVTKKKGRKQQKRLIIQLGVAGFFFGNIMLLALPEYFDHKLANDNGLQQFFRYLMMGFSLPVMLFSGQDYFKNALKALRAGHLSIDLPIALGIAALFSRSAYEVLSNTGAGYFDSLAGLIFFLLIGKWYQQKTYENFSFDRDLRSFLPLAANLLYQNGKEKSIAIDELQKGDEIMVRQGEILPADAFLQSQHCQIDYSYITGESIPVLKKRGDLIFAGAKVKASAAVFEINSSVDRSYLSTLWQGERKESHPSKNLSLTDKISQYFTPAIILLAFAGAVAWYFIDPSRVVNVFTAVLIVACPCALALSEPFANGSMMRWFGRFGFYLKSSSVLNKLEGINHMVFDKTGTLTHGDSILVDWHGADLSPAEKRAVAALCRNTPHPLSRAIYNYLAINPPADLAANFKETMGQGVSAEVSGSYYQLAKGAAFGITAQGETTTTYLQKDGETLGYFSFYQRERKSLQAVIDQLAPGYDLSILTGDNQTEEQRFRKIFPKKAALNFNQSPHQKLNYLKSLQEKGAFVLMLGDGLNDAGALQQSDVGVSLCEKNVNVFPASDALLQAEAFQLLPAFLKLSQQNRGIIKAAFAMSFLYNLVGLSFALAGILSPLIAAILMPISSVSVVIFTTLTSRFLAGQSLGNKPA